MTVTLTPMAPADITTWLVSTRVQYIADRIEAGDTEAEAIENADAADASTFPGGVPTPLQRIFDVRSGADKVGFLWIGPRFEADPQSWWVWDVEIDEQFRGRGLGRAVMVAAEGEARSEGAKTLGLNVFGHNTTARRLYESLEYETVSLQMRKQL